MKFKNLFLLLVIFATIFVSCEKQELVKNTSIEENMSIRNDLDLTCKVVDANYTENGYEGVMYEDGELGNVFYIGKSTFKSTKSPCNRSWVSTYYGHDCRGTGNTCGYVNWKGAHLIVCEASSISEKPMQ